MSAELSRAQRDRLTCAASRTADDALDQKALAYENGTACAIDRILLGGGDPSELVGWEAPTFPLKGGEIVARGVSAGPEVARILRSIERRWISEGFPSRERVEELLAEALAN